MVFIAAIKSGRLSRRCGRRDLKQNDFPLQAMLNLGKIQLIISDRYLFSILHIKRLKSILSAGSPSGCKAATSEPSEHPRA